MDQYVQLDRAFYNNLEMRILRVELTQYSQSASIQAPFLASSFRESKDSPCCNDVCRKQNTLISPPLLIRYVCCLQVRKEKDRTEPGRALREVLGSDSLEHFLFRPFGHKRFIR